MSDPQHTATARDLCAFIDASPTPFHAVATLAGRLQESGFDELDERASWAGLRPGAAAYVVRDGGSIVAFRLGEDPAAGARVIGAHTDSPTYRVRPNPQVQRHGSALLGVEVYGAPLHYTWLDRDLTLAGRVVTDGGDTRLLRLPGAPLRIPSLAIHLQRDLREKGLELNPQQHLLPMWQSDGDGSTTPELADVLGSHLGVEPSQISAWDLVLVDTQPAALGGLDDAFVFAPRQDNLVSCHAAVTALRSAAPARHTQVIVANDHEEVGSGTAEGARGPFLGDVLGRLATVAWSHDEEALQRLLAASILVSADMAHAVHPHHADRHDPGHRPMLGGGPVIKTHASQAYATDARTAAWFDTCCREAGSPVQQFTNRADSPSGSTIGPLTATRLGIPTVDVGGPTLSMHSVREQTAVIDAGRMIAAMTRHLTR